MTEELLNPEAAAAAAFGEAFRAEQAATDWCAGEIECTFPLDGNCWCFNHTLARHRQRSTAELLEALREVREAIRELRLADGHAARTGDESRFDRALPAICQHENRIKVLLAKHGAQS